MRFAGKLCLCLNVHCSLGVEKIIGWAISYHFMHSSEDSMKDSKLVISADRLVLIILKLIILPSKTKENCKIIVVWP